METVVSFLVLGTLAGKIVELFKYLKNGDRNGAFTLLSVWIAGIMVIFLGANADAFSALVVPGMEVPLGSLNWASLVLVGMSLTSFIAFGYDFKKALDNSDSAKQPPLLKR